MTKKRDIDPRLRAALQGHRLDHDPPFGDVTGFLSDGERGEREERARLVGEGLRDAADPRLKT